MILFRAQSVELIRFEGEISVTGRHTLVFVIIAPVMPPTNYFHFSLSQCFSRTKGKGRTGEKDLSSTENGHLSLCIYMYTCRQMQPYWNHGHNITTQHSRERNEHSRNSKVSPPTVTLLTFTSSQLSSSRDLLFPASINCVTK